MKREKRKKKKEEREGRGEVGTAHHSRNIVEKGFVALRSSSVKHGVYLVPVSVKHGVYVPGPSYAFMSVCMNNSTSIFLIKATHSTGNPLEFLRNLPQFQMLRTVLQQNPGMLQALLQQIGQSNPQLLQVSLRIFHMTEIYNVHVAWDPGDEAILCLVPRLRYMGRDPGDKAIFSVSFPDSSTWVEILGMRLYSLSRSQTLLRLVSEA